MSESWYEMLDRAKALGLEYANNGIAGGDTMPEESPLSGEWAGAITPKDVVEQLGGVYTDLEDWEVTDILDHWEDGYNSADWPQMSGAELEANRDALHDADAGADE